MKKILAFLLATVAIFTAVGSSIVYADFGSGVAAVAEEIKVIKSGILGRKITFSDSDFKQALCISDFKSITITKLPNSTDGALMLAGRRVKEGAIIKRKNIGSLVFIPKDKNVTESNFLFTIDGYADGKEIEFSIKFLDKINYEPSVSIEYQESLAITTQREIGFYGKMCSTDAEGDEIEYIIVSYPSSGTLRVTNKSSGEYCYTPHDSFVGKDSFRYVARDEYGNFSTLQTVNITVKERMSEIEYEDMTTRAEYNASVAMTGMGIMSGELVGDSFFFRPDDTVTKAEFVAMAMKIAGLKRDNTILESYFDDNSDIPTALVEYIATAQRNGIIHGEFKDGKLVFSPNKEITKYEAAVIMSRLLNLKSDSNVPVFSDINEIPTWARASVYAMCSAGIFVNSGELIDGNSTVTRAEAAEYLYRSIK